jgi:hypothetical protein
MTKAELIQVIVRSSGVVCVGFAVWFSFNLISNIIGILFMPSVPVQAGSVFAPVVIDLVLRITVLALLGSYLLRDGKLLFDLLDR